MLSAESFPDFDTVAYATLAFLHEQFGQKLWMVTRTEKEDWITLQANDRGYGVKQRDVFGKLFSTTLNFFCGLKLPSAVKNTANAE